MTSQLAVLSLFISVALFCIIVVYRLEMGDSSGFINCYDSHWTNKIHNLNTSLGVEM